MGLRIEAGTISDVGYFCTLITDNNSTPRACAHAIRGLHRTDLDAPLPADTHSTRQKWVKVPALHWYMLV